MATVHTRRAVARVDLGAIEHNVRSLREAAGVPVMAVVKADGYGHGAVPVALAALNAGAEWLGVAYVDEALEIRRAGVPSRILAWLLSEDDDIAAAIDEDIDLSVANSAQLLVVADVARERGIRARLHIEVDTGMCRGGVPPEHWHLVFTEAERLHKHVEVVSIWSHLANADVRDHAANNEQREQYERALAVAAEVGVHPQLRHLANSAAALVLPDFAYDLVRCGIAMYGVAPGGDLNDADALGLRPVMTLVARVAQVRRLRAGDSVSYGHNWTADRDTTIGLIPLGYADGIARAATNRGHVTFHGTAYPIVGTVCMDQFAVDFGDVEVHPDDEVLLFGANATPAHLWAQAYGQIGYELVTRLGSRVGREYTDGVR